MGAKDKSSSGVKSLSKPSDLAPSPSLANRYVMLLSFMNVCFSLVRIGFSLAPSALTKGAYFQNKEDWRDG